MRKTMVLISLSDHEKSSSYIVLKVAVTDVRVVKICLNGFLLYVRCFWLKLTLLYTKR